MDEGVKTKEVRRWGKRMRGSRWGKGERVSRSGNDARKRKLGKGEGGRQGKGF
jgi:hypothetical protein